MAWIEDRSVPFVNPYNFIRIRDHNCKREEFKKGDLTGVIKCSLITKTPTIIPNTSNNNAFCEKVCDNQGKEILDKDGKNVARSYNFFSYNNLSDKNEPYKYYEPVIPGSEIRGVIRSAYEAVTNSCLSTIDIDRVLHQRTPKVKQKAGILVRQNDKWMIQEADTYMVKISSKRCDHDSFIGINTNDYKEGQEVYINISKDSYRYRNYMPKTVTKIDTKPFPGSIKGFIHIGEDVRRKHHERIFIPKRNLISIEEKAVKNLEKLMDLYKDEKLNKNINTPQDRVRKHTGYKKFEVKEGALIYYNDDLKYLSPSLITREVFNTKVNDLLGSFVPCEKIEKKKDKSLLCDACRVFGMISADENEKSVGSRIRFSDAKVLNKRNNEEYYLKDMIINELSSPKISSTEFYMEKPYRIDCDTWNYDYAIKWDRNNPAMPIPKAYIRGRKFYWHHYPQCEQGQELDERNCKVRILDVNNEFKFDVFYENLTLEELKKLVWVLGIGGRENCLHKIGRGKPLGFGSVKINVDKVIKRNIEIKDGSIEYGSKKLTITDEAEKEKLIDIKCKNVDEFLVIADFNATIGLKVCYPIGDDGSDKDNQNAKAGHQWFLGNRSNDERGGAMRPKIKKALPEIKRPAAVLYKFKNQGVRR